MLTRRRLIGRAALALAAVYLPGFEPKAFQRGDQALLNAPPAAPVGMVVPYWTGSEIEALMRSADGWVPCDGRALSRADYPKLFDVIGTTFGGSRRRFRVPDLRGSPEFKPL